MLVRVRGHDFVAGPMTLHTPRPLVIGRSWRRWAEPAPFQWTETHTQQMKRKLLLLPCLLAGFGASWLSAATYTLNSGGTPFKVEFSTDSGTLGRITIKDSSNNVLWKNTDSGGGTTIYSVTSVSSTDSYATNLSATVTFTNSTGPAINLNLTVDTTNSQLVATLDNNTAIFGSLAYPFTFFTGSETTTPGYGVVPVDDGYVVPTTVTSFTPPAGIGRGMEWFGGTDNNNTRAWIGIVDTADDYELAMQTGTMSSTSLRGPTVLWRGRKTSNASSSTLGYQRKVRYKFLSTGGYVALAKQFRQSASDRGWLQTLTSKASSNSNVNKLIGAPIIYVWGDGRSKALLDALSSAGVSKAVIQSSINHTDQNFNFPATDPSTSANYSPLSGWFDEIRAHGYIGGFYDIYTTANSAGSGATPYDGKYSMWPANATAGYWNYVNSSIPLATVSPQMAAYFAANYRLSGTTTGNYHDTFNMDSYFFDVVCAVELYEDYYTGSTDGHAAATRSQDRDNKSDLLDIAFSNTTKALITGTEQGRSWAVPYLHWAEGKEWLGSLNPGLSDGSWDDPKVYPSIVADVKDPTNMTGNKLGNILNDGYQVPLWDLVFHDCIVTTTHWHRAQNKFLYAWDHADRVAMLRGQAPLLNMTYQGVQGSATRKPNTITAADGSGVVWSTRWANDPSTSTGGMSSRFLQTINSVCWWHERIGFMEMTNHKWLTSDPTTNRSVQMTEFSSDGGTTGLGVVTNFGIYDGSYGISGSGSLTYSGSPHSGVASLSVAPGETKFYSWPALAVGTSSLPKAGVTIAYSQTLSVSGGSAPYTWAVTSGTLPAGLTLASSTGVISGTPTTAGISTFTVQVTDNIGGTSTQSLSITVNSLTTVSIESVAGDDGYVLESSQTSGTGGSNNSANTTMLVGDSASPANAQYKSIVSFDTGTTNIPSGAVLVSAQLQLTQSITTGTNPFTWGGTCYADICTGGFNGSTSLENADFQATATAAQVATMSQPPSNNTQSTGDLNSTGLAALNVGSSGLKTQLRVYFSTGDNNNSTTDTVSFYSSNYSTSTRRPHLVVVYY